jgi:DNA-binding MarR family transcriptional regulator
MPLHGKSHIHILRPTGKFNLGYHALITYSFLVRRSRLSLPTSLRELMRLTGFSDHTLRKALEGLASLVVRSGYNLLAQPDTNGLFHLKSKEMKKWQDQYQTTIVYDLAADSLLTSIENHILCSILSFNANGKFPTTSAIAQLLCLSERTVKDKIKLLRKNGLIDRDGLCATIKDESYWLDAPTPKREKKPDLINESIAAEVAEQFLAVFPTAYEPQFISTMADWGQVMQGHIIKMLRANYSEDDVGQFWSNVQEWGGLKAHVIEKFAVQVFANMFKMAEYETALNRCKGYRGKNSCGLLELRAKAACLDLLARYNHIGIDGFMDYSPDLEKLKFKVAG